MLVQYESAIERRRQSLQSALDADRPIAERNRLGQFATPNALAIEIARYVDSLLDPRSGIRFADPSIGTGSFYSAARAVFDSSRIQSAVGIELDVRFCEAARELWAEAGLDVVRGDFTQIVATESRPAAPNVILANPPYVRHHHLARQDKERLRRVTYQTTGIDVNGLAGLYVYFVLLATAWMEDQGIGAWLIPSEFMDVNYGGALRQFLTDRVTLIRVHRFNPDDVQFGDALVSSVILVIQKTAPAATHDVEFTFGGTLAEPHARDLIPIEELRASRKWTIYPRHAKNDRRMSTGANGVALADLFRIQRGIATGSNKYFVLERSDAEQLGLPGEHLRPILPSPRHLKTTVIETNADGYPCLEPQLCLVNCELPEHLIKDRHPKLWQYLQSAAALGIRDRYLIVNRSPWYKQEKRAPAPFLCTYMGRGSSEKQPFRFIWNRSNAIGTNLYLMLYPRGNLEEMLRSYPERFEAVFSLLKRITGDELRGEGRVYGGGLHKIEPRELGRISAQPIIEHWPELERSIRRCRTASLFE